MFNFCLSYKLIRSKARIVSIENDTLGSAIQSGNSWKRNPRVSVWAIGEEVQVWTAPKAVYSCCVLWMTFSKQISALYLVIGTYSLVKREFGHMTSRTKENTTRKTAKAWPKPHRPWPIPTKTRDYTPSLCSFVENRARLVCFEWTSTVTRCENGRAQCKHRNHWFKIENSEVKSASIRKPKKVCLLVWDPMTYL